MLDLEGKIAEWRRQMVTGKIKSPEVLDELESHLRDDVEEQTRAGMDAQEAFAIALERLGRAAVLESEFEKVGEAKKSSLGVKRTILTLAGIPNQYVSETMNASTPNIEPRWATYCKGAAFLAPAVILWLMSVVFVVPKLEQISADAGGQPLPTVIRMMIGLTHNGLLIWGSIVALLLLLEWRSSQWPRYRRAVVGFGMFLLNAIILISIFMMVVAALLAAPALMHHAG
jgi:hypothetical protein